MTSRSICRGISRRPSRAGEGREREVVVVCRSGHRSLLSARSLEILGFENVASLKMRYAYCHAPAIIRKERKSRLMRFTNKDVGEEREQEASIFANFWLCRAVSMVFFCSI